MKRPTVIWTIERMVAVWMAVPTVKMPDQMRMEPRRPKRSEVKAWAIAPTNVLHCVSGEFECVDTRLENAPR